MISVKSQGQQAGHEPLNDFQTWFKRKYPNGFIGSVQAQEAVMREWKIEQLLRKKGGTN